jgi:hypothetical protein
LNRYAPLHFMEFCLRCERLESFGAALACLPDGADTSNEEDKLATMMLERSLMRAGELWEWTDCAIPWPEGSSST